MEGACLDIGLCFPEIPSTHHWTTPRREILTKDDLDRFKDSETCKRFVGFLLALNSSVRDKPIPALPHSVSENVKLAVQVLETVEGYIDMFKPVANSKSRFGNPAFQSWFDHVESTLGDLYAPLKVSVTLDLHDRQGALKESFEYLLHSFGNRKRIDYGTGHEANFVCWLYCLTSLGCFDANELDKLVLVIFNRYIRLMRHLQEVYWLEPAGSHGVWGLDDFHFLTFMFGSSQLLNHRHLKPKSIHDSALVQDLAPQYMYFANILWIQTSKSAPGLADNPHSLRWHSPMLDDISGVKTWEKVNSGMIKMYLAEVLGKLPIMQHFLFGSILSFKTSGNVLDESDEKFHVHAMGQEFPGCCGVRIPSAVAAARAQKGVNDVANASATAGPAVNVSETVVNRVGNVAESGQFRKPPAKPIKLTPIPKPDFLNSNRENTVPFD